MSIRKNQLQIIQKGLQLLMTDEKTMYDQITILNKLKFLEFEISKASLSNLYTQKQVGNKIIKKAVEGLTILIKSELCMEYNIKTDCFENILAPCKMQKVPEFGELQVDLNLPYTLHTKGRLFISEKTKLIASAKQSIYEIGIRLRRFTDYFTTRSDEEYKSYVENVLSKGVDFKCYLLDPDSNVAQLYFRDLAKIFPKEKKSSEIIKETANELISISEEFNKKGYDGKFEVFIYSNIPFNAFLAIDPFSSNGQMIVQHYIYGLERRKAPTLQFTKKRAPSLFDNYLIALKAITSNAKQLTKRYPI